MSCSVDLSADRLVAARRSGTPLADAPAVPDMEAAMATQRAVAERLHGTAPPVGGWKVGLHPEHGAVAAPLLGTDLIQSGQDWPLTEGLGLEVEIAIRLKRDLPAGPIARSAMIGEIASVHLGLELVRSRLRAGSSSPFLAFVADQLANEAYVLADPFPEDAPLKLAGRSCRVWSDGALVHEAHCAESFGDILAPVLAWVARQNDRFGGLRAGQIVTTGTVCGVIPIGGVHEVRAEIDGFGAILVRTR